MRVQAHVTRRLQAAATCPIRAIRFVLVASLALAGAAHAALGAGWYVRTGGNNNRCTGQTDADYVSGSYPQNCAFRTIVKAVSVASASDTIAVAAGAYAEAPAVGVSLTITGTGNPSVNKFVLNTGAITISGFDVPRIDVGASGTLQDGVDGLPSGGTLAALGSSYAQSFTISGKSLKLLGQPTTANGITLTAGATLVAGPNTLTAPTVQVDQAGGAGAKIQDGVNVTSPSGTLTVGAGSYGETVTVDHAMAVTGSGNPSTTKFVLTDNPVTITGFDVSAIDVDHGGGKHGTIADAVAAVNGGGTVTAFGAYNYAESVTVGKALSISGSGNPVSTAFTFNVTGIALSGFKVGTVNLNASPGITFTGNNIATINVAASVSLQEGVDGANVTGTTVNALGASYTEDVVISGKNVKLVGTGTTEVNSFTLTSLGAADGSNGITAPNTYVNALGAGGGSIDGGAALVDVGGAVHVAAGTYNGAITIKIGRAHV
jgi:trimeric autotransporter adhesin